MYRKIKLGFILLVLLNVHTITTTVQDKLDMYEQHFNTSIKVEKEDKGFITSWTEDFQVQMVEVTTKYRLEMTRHQLHSFRKRLNNKKWQECLSLFENVTTKSEQAYYIRENKCLKDASSSDGDKKQAVMQIGREIRKWRRTYKYLKYDYCRVNGEPDTMCFSRSMEKDNFGYAFERLINLREKALQELRQQITKAVDILEDCLKTDLSLYLGQHRTTMDVLARCYG